MRLTYQKVFGTLGGALSLGLTLLLVIHLGTPGRPMGLGLGILVILITYVCYGVGAAIGAAFDKYRARQIRSNAHSKPSEHLDI